MYQCVRTGNHVVQTVYQSSHIWTWKESEADQSLIDVRTGFLEVQTDASWNRSFSIQWRVRTERYVIQTDDASLSGIWTGWHVVQTDGTMDRWAFGRDDTSSGRLTGNLKSSIFNAESSENALTSGIPVYSTFTYKWFCPNTEWGQNTNRFHWRPLQVGDLVGRCSCWVTR
jgi:hypothetical protein